MHTYVFGARVACFILLRLSLTVHGQSNSSDTRPYPGVPADLSSFAAAPFWPYQTFVTEPEFHPPVLEISKQPEASDGLLVFAPLPFLLNYTDRPAVGLIMDQLGNPIWHSANGFLGQLEVQQLNDQNVLTYWTGGIGGGFIDAHGMGTITILDSTYRLIQNVTLNDGTFKAGDSMQNMPYPSYIDIHESFITPKGSLIVTAYNSTPYNLSAVGGPADGWLLDSLIYEFDLRTNETLFRWSSVEHIDQLPLNGSYHVHPDGSIIDGSNATHPWDYFLTNSVFPLDDGYILSCRHYWSVIALDSQGNVKWNLNGEDGGDFEPVNQTRKSSTFSWQHYARPRNGTADRNLVLDMFNNHGNGFDNGTYPSTGLTLYLDLQKRTVETISQLQDPEDTIYALSQGTFQRLPNDHKLVAYGQIPRLKEYDNNDRVVMNARFGQDNQVSSYRSYLVSNWSATPYWAPKIATTQEQGGNVTLSMSWNGATPDVYDTWMIYESTDVNGPLTDVSQQVRRTGYETNATLSAGTRLVTAAAGRGQEAMRRSKSLQVELPTI